MIEVKIRSVVPIYSVAAFCLLYSLFFPLYTLVHFIIFAALSAAVYAVASHFFPGVTRLVEAPPPEPNSPEAAAVADEGKKALSEFNRLSSAIRSEEVRKKIGRLTGLTEQIIAEAIRDPKDIPRIRRFLNYYLPTTIKLLDQYAILENKGKYGENISGSITKIEAALDTLISAYRKQLDALFADEALDIETDIEVMDSMLKAEGLKDKDF